MSGGSVAALTIPGLLNRARVFDIDVQLKVRVPADGRATEMSLSLELDGSQQWSRTAPGLTPGEIDTLEYHCRLVLEPERQLRLRARAKARGGVIEELLLSAVEEASA